ncbi:hypothetical protein [Bordetella genomosp. 13]|uniref:hypothetical protein n=1 Tax=Bordetella genomosp. 13 TaxID=463040 RepID=UPI0011A1F8D6|nr:hypothetical protein [Bordetella genomosp. 13]
MILAQPVAPYLVAHCGVPDPIVASTLRLYEEPQRHYHNVDHLARMVDAAQAHGIALDQAQALALLFHDAVYVAGAPKGANEQLSALLLRARVHGLVDAGVTDMAARIIVDTTSHFPSHARSTVVLDLDLLGLAGSLDEARRDGELIYKENAHLVDGWADYAKRRSQFLQTLLDRPKILYSQELQHREKQLRTNLREIIRTPDVRLHAV